MTLATIQYQALKGSIVADASLAAFVATANDRAITDIYNAAAAPAFIVWRKQILVEEIRAILTWSEIVTLTAAQRDAFALLLQSGVVDATRSNVRGGFSACLTGTASLTALTALAKRSATVFEKLFADTTGGNGANATPAVAVLEGPLSVEDVSIALRNF